MAVLNANLTEAAIPGYVKRAFKGGKGRVVTIEARLPLWKLSEYALPADGDGAVTPWWAPVNPYREDRMGARGRFLEARLNKVSMVEMVRYAAAVRVDWNALSDYQEITLDVICKGFFGQFEPQPPMSADDDVWDGSKTATPDQGAAIKKAKLDALRKKGQYVPTGPNEMLGGIEAYQFWIPNIRKSMVKSSSSIPAHDKRAMSLHLFHRILD